jgi:hypothetical protein
VQSAIDRACWIDDLKNLAVALGVVTVVAVFLDVRPGTAASTAPGCVTVGHDCLSCYDGCTYCPSSVEADDVVCTEETPYHGLDWARLSRPVGADRLGTHSRLWLMAHYGQSFFKVRRD